MNKRLAKIEFDEGFAVVTQSADGEVVIRFDDGTEALRTRDINEAAAWVGGMVFSDHYADEPETPLTDVVPTLYSALRKVAAEPFGVAPTPTNS